MPDTEDTTEIEDLDLDEPRVRPRRPLNPVALVVGLLYATIGAGVLADQVWSDIDLTVITGAAAVIAGIVVITVLLRRRS